MSSAEAVAGVMFAAVILYAVFGGADFGSGVWDLTAGGVRRGAATRRLVDHAIGPVWEANHVWLIFVLVLLFTGFPAPFAEIMRDLAVPFWLAGLGIVVRGAGFAFRKYAPSLRAARWAGIAFAASSVITPFFLGTIAGSVASGRVRADGAGEIWSTWTGPTSLLGGVLATATCTFLAGVFLAAEADALGDDPLADELRSKTLLGGVITGAIAVAGIPVLFTDADTLVDGLLGRALVLVLASVVAGVTTLELLRRRRYRTARVTAIVAVAAIVAGWGVAQHPWILVDEVTIDDGAGDPATLTGLTIAALLAVSIVAPSLAWLYRLADTNRVGLADPPSRDDPET